MLRGGGWRRGRARGRTPTPYAGGDERRAGYRPYVEPDWNAIYGLLITATGWSFEYIDAHVTFSRYNRLVDYWSKNPPLHLLLGALLRPGAQGDGRERKVVRYDQNSVGELLAAWRAVGGAVS
jgi:hypothetical protein